MRIDGWRLLIVAAILLLSAALPEAIILTTGQVVSVALIGRVTDLVALVLSFFVIKDSVALSIREA
jgi:hypothetical protein